MMKYFKRVCICAALFILWVNGCCAEQRMYIDRTETIDEMRLYTGELSNITYYEVDEEHPLYTSVEGVLYTKDKKCLLSYPASMPQSRYQVEKTTERIGNYAFAYASVEYIDLLSSEGSAMTEIGDGAFWACRQLKQICIPKSVQKVGKEAFSNTSEDLLVILDQGASVREAIPESVKMLVLEDLYDVQEWMAHNDEIWTYCKLVGNERYKVMDECLFHDGCLIAYPGLKRDPVYVIPERTKRVDARILQNNDLEKLVVPASCEWIQTVQQEENSFAEFVVDPSNPVYSACDGVLFDRNCTVLIAYPSKRQESVYRMPDTVTCIGDDSFEYCAHVEEIVSPHSLREIGSFAFYDSSLQKINIPDSVTSIELDAFEYCPELMKIVVSEGSYAEKMLTTNTDYIDLSDKLVCEE